MEQPSSGRHVRPAAADAAAGPSRIRRTWAVGGALLAAGFASGYAIGRIAAPPRDADTQAATRPAIAATVAPPTPARVEMVPERTAPEEERRLLRPTPRPRAGSAVDDFLAQLAATPPNPDDVRSLNATDRMSAEEVRAALDRVREMEPGPARAMAENALVRRWAQLEPLKTLEWVKDVREPARRHDLKREILLGWAATEPLQALVYVEMESDKPDGERLRSVFEGVKSADAETAMAFLSRIDEAKYGRAAAEIVGHQFAREPGVVLGRIESMSDGPLKQMSVDRVIDQWARYDPAAAKAWMEAHVTPETRLSAQVELGESWARVDPQSATAWFQQLPADQQNPRILDRIVRRWIQYEPETGTEWLRAQPPSPVLDNPRTERAVQAARTDPSEALAWVQTISDPNRRNSIEEHVSWQWFSRDRAAAVDYVLNRSGLSEASKRRFAERAERDLRAGRQP